MTSPPDPSVPPVPWEPARGEQLPDPRGQWVPVQPVPPDHLSQPHPSSPPSSAGDKAKKALGPLGAIGVFLAKFGAVLVKFKAFTVVGSMAVSVAAYALLWGWKFAAGFVGLIFVHEMGHVVALRRRGIKAGAPVFLPFLGAFVSMKQMPRSVYEEAETALAGPVVGTLGAAAVAWVASANGSALLRDLAFTGFLLNLFNLLPALPLDGGRVAGALHPAVWALGLAALLVVEVLRPSPVIPIILLLGGYELWRRWRGRDSEESRRYFALPPGQRLRIGSAYLGLIVVLLVAMHATYVSRPLHS